jgi:hypothetical protein
MIGEASQDAMFAGKICLSRQGQLLGASLMRIFMNFCLFRIRTVGIISFCTLISLISLTTLTTPVSNLVFGQQTSPPTSTQVQENRNATNPDQSENTQQTQRPESDNQSEKTQSQDNFLHAELPPLKRIVMYNSGVGQMQHSGTVDGNQRMEIRFGNHDVNDVLKSIVFEDKGGGIVNAVEYQPAPEPEDVAATQIGQPLTLAQLLQKFRGERVELKRRHFTYSGVIYGVENRMVGDQIVETVILITDQGMEAVPLSDVDNTRFANEELRNEMNLAMAGLAKSRKANTQALELLLEGEGKREVQFAYVVDVPIWRMTYRLALSDKSATLQGWAHIDNITGVDWQDVTIELRSGKPQAFHINIFDPLMAERPKLGNALFDYTNGLALIQKMFGGFRSEPDASGGFGTAGLGGGGFGGGFGGPALGNSDGGVDIESAFRAAATGGRASQMVTFKLDKPVNLGAGKSAALPVFSNPVPVRQLSIYTDTQKESVVLRALEITNHTKSPIISGPISIVGDGDFVGDAKLSRLSIGETAEMIFGIDRAVDVQRDQTKTETKLVEARLNDGNMELINRYNSSLAFEVNNKDPEPRRIAIHFSLSTLSLHHKKYETMSMEEIGKWLSPAPTRISDEQFTYEIDVEAQTSKTLEIKLAYTDLEKVPLNVEISENGLQMPGSLSAETVRRWIRNDVKVSDTDMAIINELISKAESIQSVIESIAKIKNEISEYERDQSRVRSNLEVVLKDPDAAKIYLDKLKKLEEQIEAAKEKAKAEQDKLDQLESQLNEKIISLRQ